MSARQSRRGFVKVCAALPLLAAASCHRQREDQLTSNGVPLRQQWESVRDELRLIRIFQELGVRMMHLTYNRRNPIGDGTGEPNDGGLSEFGHAVVDEMNRLGVIVDVAHSGWRTSFEAKASKKPIVPPRAGSTSGQRTITSPSRTPSAASRGAIGRSIGGLRSVHVTD